jgi:hypothetical protein
LLSKPEFAEGKSQPTEAEIAALREQANKFTCAIELLEGFQQKKTVKHTAKVPFPEIVNGNHQYFPFIGQRDR